MKNTSLVQFDDGHKLTEQDFMHNIDNIIVHLYETGDTATATKMLSALEKIDVVSGHAKAKLLYGFNDWWRENKPDENFCDYIESTTPTKGITVKRYVMAWKQVEQNVIPKAVAQRPMRDLVPIAMTIAQGHDISKEQWRKLELCANDGELRDVLRKIKGQEPRKSAKVLKLERDGTISLWVKNEKKFVGFLNLKDAETDEDIAAAIEKIKSIGMIEE